MKNAGKIELLLLVTALALTIVGCSPREIPKPDTYQKAAIETKTPEELFQMAKPLYDQKRYEEAAPLMLAAGEEGNAEAQMHLGKMFFNGWGVPHDHEKGIYWHKKAAAQGNAESIQKLKKMEH